MHVLHETELVWRRRRKEKAGGKRERERELLDASHFALVVGPSHAEILCYLLSSAIAHEPVTLNLTTTRRKQIFKRQVE